MANNRVNDSLPDKPPQDIIINILKKYIFMSKMCKLILLFLYFYYDKIRFHYKVHVYVCQVTIQASMYKAIVFIFIITYRYLIHVHL